MSAKVRDTLQEGETSILIGVDPGDLARFPVHDLAGTCLSQLQHS